MNLLPGDFAQLVGLHDHLAPTARRSFHNKVFFTSTFILPILVIIAIITIITIITIIIIIMTIATILRIIDIKSVQQLGQVWLAATEAGGSLQLQPGATGKLFIAGFLPLLFRISFDI